MAIYKVDMVDASRRTRRDGVDSMIVAAGSAAAARLAAASKYGGDTAWSDATVTALVDTLTVGSTDGLVGWRFTISVTGAGAAGATGIVTVTGATTSLDTLDEIGAALATALNGLTGIGNAAYTAGTQTLVVATGSGGDDLGDQTIGLYIYPPVVNDADGNQLSEDVNMQSVLVDSITDGGVATDDLEIVFLADTTVVPTVLATGKQ